MIVLDYLIANEDRHLNNFGVIRNAETLEWLGFAPSMTAAPPRLRQAARADALGKRVRLQAV